MKRSDIDQAYIGLVVIVLGLAFSVVLPLLVWWIVD